MSVVFIKTGLIFVELKRTLKVKEFFFVSCPFGVLYLSFIHAQKGKVVRARHCSVNNRVKQVWQKIKIIYRVNVPKVSIILSVN